MKKNKIIAHRGAWKEFDLPENSIASLKKAISLGCYGSEFDVHLTKDRIAVVAHDHMFHDLPIETTNYNELLHYKLANGELLSTVEDFLAIGLNQTSTKLFLEIKTSEIGGTHRTKELVDVIVDSLPDKANPSILEFILFDLEAAIYLKNLNPEYLVHYLEGDKSAEEISKIGIDGMDYNWKLLNKDADLIKSFKNFNLKTNAWTVNDLQIANNFLLQGIDCITTDVPALFLKKLS